MEEREIGGGKRDRRREESGLNINGWNDLYLLLVKGLYINVYVYLVPISTCLSRCLSSCLSIAV